MLLLPHNEPVLRFHCVIEQARPPQRADRSAAGTLPARAARYCDAITAAAAFGWYVFPPIEFELLWDGADIFWTCAAVGRWLKLDAVQFPNFSESFDAAAPDPVKGCSPPFLTALPEPGTVQLWTGVLARTALASSLLVRAPANLPAAGGYVLYEGIVETDRWFGPLFTNLRLTRTDVPVRFRADMPLLQVQPLPRAVYSDRTLDKVAMVNGLGGPGPNGLGRTTIAASRGRAGRPLNMPSQPGGGGGPSARSPSNRDRNKWVSRGLKAFGGVQGQRRGLRLHAAARSAGRRCSSSRSRSDPVEHLVEPGKSPLSAAWSFQRHRLLRRPVRKPLAGLSCRRASTFSCGTLFTWRPQAGRRRQQNRARPACPRRCPRNPARSAPTPRRRTRQPGPPPADHAAHRCDRARSAGGHKHWK